jgi:hypothetical protein
MTAEEWALAATVFFTGLSAGFLGALCTIIRPMLQAMDGRGFRNFMEVFLRYAGGGWGKWYNLAWAFVPVVGSIVALVLLWDDPGSTSFILTAIGLVIVAANGARLCRLGRSQRQLWQIASLVRLSHYSSTRRTRCCSRACANTRSSVCPPQDRCVSKIVMGLMIPPR